MKSKNALGLVVALVTVASTARCGREEEPRVYIGPSELLLWTQEYETRFGNATGLQLVEVSLEAEGTLPAEYAGACLKTPLKARIWLSAAVWEINHSAPCQRKALLWHELGHCLGGLPDVESKTALMAGTPVWSERHWCAVLALDNPFSQD
jgi:hypothetical protein